MKMVKYSINDPWVKRIECPNCQTEILYWYSSGMSEMFPHFYCDRCSNVVCRKSDKQKVYVAANKEEILKEIECILPNCECGGKFKATTNPKCPKCNFEFKHQLNSVDRLSDPHIILINGAVLYDESGPVYCIEID